MVHNVFTWIINGVLYHESASIWNIESMLPQLKDPKVIEVVGRRLANTRCSHAIQNILKVMLIVGPVGS